MHIYSPVFIYHWLPITRLNMVNRVLRSLEIGVRHILAELQGCRMSDQIWSGKDSLIGCILDAKRFKPFWTSSKVTIQRKGILFLIISSFRKPNYLQTYFTRLSIGLQVNYVLNYRLVTWKENFIGIWYRLGWKFKIYPGWHLNRKLGDQGLGKYLKNHVLPTTLS